MGWHLKSSTSSQVRYQAPTTWELQAWDIQTPVSIMCILCLWKGALSDNFIFFMFFFWLTHFDFLDVLGFFCFVRYLDGAICLPMWCHFRQISVLLGSFGVLWRPRFRRGSCQVGCIVPASWEFAVGNIRTAVVERNILRQLYLLFFFFWLTRFVFFDVLSLFYIVPYRNLTVWFFICCHFCVISILYVSYWGPMEATFSSWVLPSRLNCARELRTSNLNHKDCCSHHLQTWFVDGNVVRQLGLLLWIILTS